MLFQIGIVKPGVPIDIVLNTETKRKTPMTVYIKGDERLFGDSAVTRVRFVFCTEILSRVSGIFLV